VEEVRGTWVGVAADDPRNPGHAAIPAVQFTFATSMPTHVNGRIEIGEGLSVSIGATGTFN
jgi:hypothetical protein